MSGVRAQSDETGDRRAYLLAALEYGVSPLVARESTEREDS